MTGKKPKGERESERKVSENASQKPENVAKEVAEKIAPDTSRGKAMKLTAKQRAHSYVLVRNLTIFLKGGLYQAERIRT